MGSEYRDKILNVISLEFSDTKLARDVRGPKFVQELDWIRNIWPTYRKKDNDYPKVQHYCLMSVKGCYTDFHIDFGGTSVWYNVMQGEKEFFLLPPTEDNLDAFEEWTSSSRQNKDFFKFFR